ncbi:Xanthine dehydrogenase [Fulvivirga imtechensis AK7]|uniref:Xanthine dehydrogenase n=1 Tax=Fulvivirga imtechensis AK7 TaxID=1237149 RepID=L8JXS7_9BACT|nr:Xanthine dehydrogenase [Fulvivirga imtechensis AK7]
MVTIEGLNMEQLTPVQQAFVDTGGTQCGFCTVGFIMSLSGYCLSAGSATLEEGISAIDGNICRCTGYKSIERATGIIVSKLSRKDDKHPIDWLIREGFIPGYFAGIPERLIALQVASQNPNGRADRLPKVGGGTDVYVQRPDDLVTSDIHPFFDLTDLKSIFLDKNICYVGAGATATDLLESDVFNSMFPNLRKHLKLISSTQIRNMGTIAGNLVNASPIGDLTAFFLALNATLTINKPTGEVRKLPLKEFYLAYRKVDLKENEAVEMLEFHLPDENTFFNFEKVSKRTYLDIASVNTAIRLAVINDNIEVIDVSAGGVFATPLYLEKTCAFLKGKQLSSESVSAAAEILDSEISPISDIRGSKEYKRLLLRQLFFAHFIELFPQKNLKWRRLYEKY